MLAATLVQKCSAQQCHLPQPCAVLVAATPMPGSDISTVKSSLCFSPADPALLAAACDNGTVCVWNIKTQLTQAQLPKRHQVGAGSYTQACSSTCIHCPAHV